MGQRILFCCWAICFLIFVRSGQVLALAYEVWPEETTGSLEYALETAQDGDTILVHAGRYPGNIVLNKAVSLIGRDNPILDGEGNGDVITVLANDVTIRGFTIQGSGRNVEKANAGIRLKSVQSVTIQECLFVDNLFGMYLERASGNTIVDNEIRGLWSGQDTSGSGNGPGGSSVSGGGSDSDGGSALDGGPAETRDGHLFRNEIGDGIHLFSSSENILERNVINQTRDGIYFNYAHTNQTIGNEISEVRYGIHFMNSDDNVFRENTLYDNKAGAALMFSKRIRLENNVFAFSRGFRAYGILFATCDYSVAEGNIFMNNTIGIFCDISRHNVFRGNLFYRNDVGLDLISSSADNLFFENNFIDNLQPVAMPAGRVGDDNLFYKDGVGNYWDDYRGFDLDRDGIGDIPHKTGDPFTFLMAKSPGVRLFLSSPAATALEFSERMFPVVHIPKVVDPYPLTEPVKMDALASVHSTMSQSGLDRHQGTFALIGCSILMLVAAGSLILWASSPRFRRTTVLKRGRKDKNG
ncbi:MAG: right-handed parallel beta-helix repeat-containing protein [Peptococcaceae bacterium]|nr:right-handed parallel beta-helix repeat-containing protein [Peptococcaceae bacterium]